MPWFFDQLLKTERGIWFETICGRSSKQQVKDSNRNNLRKLMHCTLRFLFPYPNSSSHRLPILVKTRNGRTKCQKNGESNFKSELLRITWNRGHKWSFTVSSSYNWCPDWTTGTKEFRTGPPRNIIHARKLCIIQKKVFIPYPYPWAPCVSWKRKKWGWTADLPGPTW